MKEIEKLFYYMLRKCSAEAMCRLFDGHEEECGKFWLPHADVLESSTHVIVRAEIAGLKQEALKIYIAPDSKALIISGRRQEKNATDQEKIRYYQMEVYFGYFERRVALPFDIEFEKEGIETDYNHGLLTITIPKSENSFSEESRYITSGKDV